MRTETRGSKLVRRAKQGLLLGPLGLLLSACAKEPPKETGPIASARPVPPRVSAPPAPPPAPASTCAVEAEKVWATNASPGAGITRTVLDGDRVAFGVVLGGRPDVIVFDAKGEGKAVHVGVKKALTEPLPAEGKDAGRRDVQRVTPALGAGGKVIAFVDWREIRNERRHVACGASDAPDAKAELLSFDGKPLVAVDEDRVDKAAKPVPGAVPAPGETEAAQAEEPKPPKQRPKRPPGPHKRPSLSSADPSIIAAAMEKREAAEKARAAAAALSASAKPAEPAPTQPPPAPPTAPPAGDRAAELRECRTLVDRGGTHAWAVGSELSAQPLADGTTDYDMTFFAEPVHGKERVPLHTASLGKTPAKLPTFEVPTSIDLAGATFVVATRFKGSILAWLLDGQKRPRGPARVYAGRSAAAPVLVSFGDTGSALLVQQIDARGHSSVRALELQPALSALPAALTEVALGPIRVAGAPSVAAVGTRRFVGVETDDTGHPLFVVATDASFAATAAPLSVDTGVYESELAPLADGRLLVVYLRNVDGRVELVSRTVRC